MSSLKQKSAPIFQPSSSLLDKRWKTHDYQVHNLELFTLLFLFAILLLDIKWNGPIEITLSQLKKVYGEQTSYPTYPPLSPRSAAKARHSSHDPPHVSFQRDRKSARTERPRIDAHPRPVQSAKPRIVTRPQSNTQGERQRPKSVSHVERLSARPSTTLGPAKKSPRLQRNRWVHPASQRPSPYSLDAQNEHWKKHLYYRNVILGRRQKKSPRRIKPKSEPEEEKSSTSGEEADGEEADNEEEEPDGPNESSAPAVPEKVPTPPPKTPTPEPGVRMDFDGSDDEEKKRTPKPPLMTRPRSSRSYRSFVPPSHILKIVRDAEPSSDSSWSDSENESPRLILRDGKPGHKYVLLGKQIKPKSNSSGSAMSDGSDNSSDNEMMLTKKFIQKPQTPVGDADFKDDGSSGESYDEYGRLKKRYKRPDSAMDDLLPPIALDPCDHGDLNNTQARLLRDTLLVREGLLNENGLDLETVVDTIIRNNNTNRRWIRKIYRDEYLESLLTMLRKTLPADLASVVTYMMLPPAEYDAMCLRDAMKGLQKGPEVLIEVLCTRNNEEIQEIKEKYIKRYDADLLDDLEDETSGAFQRILLTLAMGKREEDHGEIDKEEALKIVKGLYAILGVKGDQMERKFTEIFAKLGWTMLRTVLVEYRKFRHYELESDVINEFSGNMRRCLLTIIQYIQNPPGYFVEKIHGTHYGGLDDDKTLTRIIISRQDRDYKMIMELFKLRYDMKLFDYIRSTCHSTERGLMLRLIAGQLPEEQRRLLVSKLPKLVAPSALVTFNKQLSLNDAIIIILRKIQVSTTLIKALNLRRERIAKLEEESIYELEIDYDGEENEEEQEGLGAGLEDGDDSEDEGREDQEELRNNLKNLDFNEQETATETVDGPEKKRSALAQVSFSLATRGINREQNRVKFKTDGDGSGNDSDGNGSQNESSMPSAMPPPVQDPAFIGRRDSNFFEKVVPFIKGRRKKYYRGTIPGIPMEEFNALKDAQAVGRALLQKNRNVDGILKFLIARNNSQRQLIVREFFRRYRRDLVNDLRHLTGLEMQDFILGIMLAPEMYDSCCIFEAWSEKTEGEVDDIDGEDTFTDTIIKILCTRGNDEIGVMKRAYLGIFGKDLKEVIESVTFGWIRILLVNILKCERDEGDIVDEKLAQKDALRLAEIHQKGIEDYDAHIEILTSRNFTHLKDVFNQYSKITSLDILESLETDISGAFLEALTAIICNVRDAAMYFSETIYQAMALHPMDHRMLIRCIIARAEVDLSDIKATFRRTYGRSMNNMVEKECNAKYKDYIIEVLGKGKKRRKKKPMFFGKLL
eukprot:gene20578-22603_t